MANKFFYPSVSNILEDTSSIPFVCYATRASGHMLKSVKAIPFYPSETTRKKSRRQIQLEAHALNHNLLSVSQGCCSKVQSSCSLSNAKGFSVQFSEVREKSKTECMNKGKEGVLRLQHNSIRSKAVALSSPRDLSCSTSIHSTLGTSCSKIDQSPDKENRHEGGLTSSENSPPFLHVLLSSKSPYVHPASLWKDEESILHRFGMGGRVSPPTVPGFSGFFRQHWKDFYVTEMFYTNRSNDPSEGQCQKISDVACVPRQYDFSIPPLPSSLGSSFLSAKEVVECEEQQESKEKKENAEGAGTAIFFLLQAKVQETGSYPSLRPEKPPSESFFSVDVEKRLKKISLSEDTEHNEENQDQAASGARKCSSSLFSSSTILQCILHKRHIAHSTALSLLAQTLRKHPRAISVAGMKDYIGDTVQRIRLENVSPSDVLRANTLFKQSGVGMTLSHFSYEQNVLLPGDLYGNHFKIILRGVHAPASVIHDAIQGLEKYGFPNYYGCQRFSWFGGVNDAAFALLMHNPLVFAFRFLNYTSASRTLRELLQRPWKYPHPVQDQYRRNVVRRLRRLSIEPSDLDEDPFLSCPSLADMYEGSDSPYTIRQNLIIGELWHSFFDLDVQSRRPTAQSLSSYLWNQALTLRLHHFGGQKVLEGDFCIQKRFRQQAKDAGARSAVNKEHMVVARPEIIPYLSIEDVVHPGFSFQGIDLPKNPVGDFYLDICNKYHLSWHARHAKGGLKDFLEPPRPIVRRPHDLRYQYDQQEEKLTVSFALERGCYANVAVSELMKLTRCAGSDQIRTVPMPDSCWDSIGQQDPGYVTSLQDIYVGYEDGLGFVKDNEDLECNTDTAEKIWDVSGPLFLPSEKDPYTQAVNWGKRHLLRSAQRRELDAALEKKRLFEKPLADVVSDEELQKYAGHIVPLPPNAKQRKVRKSISKRRRQYPGAPTAVSRIHRSIATRRKASRIFGLAISSSGPPPEFQKLNGNSWNVTW